jgi:hypothetical protein
MAHDGDPTHTSHEKSPEIKNDFAQSMDRLVELLPTGDPRPGAKRRFYRVEWDSERPDKITDIVTMSAAATGARKEELMGRFNQAQFRITESGDAETSERFVWLRTGYQTPGTPIRVDQQSLYDEVGYLEATPANVCFTMSDHVRTVSDYLRLAEEMNRYEVEMPPGLRDRAVDLLRKFTKGGNIAANLETDTLPAFAELLNGVGESYGGQLRHLLLSNLIDGFRQYGDDPIAPGKAAAILEVVLREQVLPPKPALMERLLVCHPIYEYPFAIELLHTTLQDRPETNWSTHIFGIERIAFTQKYVSTVLGSRAHNSDERSVTGNRKIAALSRFMQEGYKDEGLVFVGDTLRQVLARLRDADPLVAEDQKALDKKIGDTVDRLLRPVIDKKMGLQALRVTRRKSDPSS